MKYKVGYSKMGELIYDVFDELDVAIKDYNIKLKLDKDGVFDDRFVVGVWEEDENGIRTKIERFKKMTYKAAVIGCGRIGCGFDDDYERRNITYTHAGAYAKTDLIDFVAIADVEQYKIDRYSKKYNVRGYTDYKELLDIESPDIVSVSTRPDTHCEIIEACVAAGVRAIYCEKPIDNSLDKAKKIIDLCSKNKVLLTVNHQRRYGKFHQQLARAIQSGALGSIQQCTVYYTAGIANTGSHFIDLLRFYLGKEVKSVRGKHSINKSTNEFDPNIDGWIIFDGGITASIQPCANFGILEVIIVSLPDPLGAITDYSYEYMLGAIEHIIQHLENKNNIMETISTGHDALCALEVIHALIHSSNQNGESVSLPFRKHIEIQGR